MLQVLLPEVGLDIYALRVDSFCPATQVHLFDLQGVFFQSFKILILIIL